MSPRQARAARALTAVLRGERAVTAAAVRALTALGREAAAALAAAGFDTSVLDDRLPGWRAAVDTDLAPTIESVFTRAWDATAAGNITSPGPYAVQHLEAVHNRLVATSNDVFDSIRVELAHGRELQESIPELAARVNAMLVDGGAELWKGRATTIARTEVVAANNAGGQRAAGVVAETLGHSSLDVAKEWLATGDGRTRESHADADGQVVIGLDTPFTVGGTSLDVPGDAYGDPGEVINCRCTALYHYPGDPDYPSLVASALTAATQEAAVSTTPAETEPTDADEERTGAVVVALPAADDPVNDIGEEDPKHVTLLYLGDTGDGLMATLDEVVTALTPLVAGLSGLDAPVSVTGVESLGTDGARVWMLDPADPTAVRDALLADDFLAGLVDAADQFPTYTPHMTIGYDPAVEPDPAATPADDATVASQLDEATETAAAAITSITLDRIAVLWAGEQTVIDPAAVAEPAAVTAAAGDQAPVTADFDAGDVAPMLDAIMVDDLGDQFHGVAVVEDSETGDGRVFTPGAIAWADNLPFPFGWQPADQPGHDGAIIVGRIDTFTREGNQITYEGTWDLDGAGWEARRLVAGGFLSGVSVDTDDFDCIVVNRDGSPVNPLEAMFGGDEGVLAVQRARIRSITACRVPAFVEATLVNGPRTAPAVAAEPVAEDVATPVIETALVAAAGPGRSPVTTQPASAFANPELSEATPVTIDGRRVFGHLAAWGTCHIGVQDRCVTPPFSQTGYAHFMLGQSRPTEAGRFPVGQITMGTGHAATHLSPAQALAHYDNTGTAVADITVGEDNRGIWFSGMLREETTDEQVEALIAGGALSGDWRGIGGNLELVAALAVNVPGFPLPRIGLAASAGEQTALVASGVVTPAQPGEPLLLSMTDVRREVAAAMIRVERATRASAQLREYRVRRAQARVRNDRVRKAAARMSARG